MPKKTRKEKIVAEYRKKIKLLQNTQPHKSSSSPAVTPAPALSKVSQQSYRETVEDQLVGNYFKQDLKKSLLLIIGIITLEIFFYFVSINNILRLGT